MTPVAAGVDAWLSGPGAERKPRPAVIPGAPQAREGDPGFFRGKLDRLPLGPLPLRGCAAPAGEDRAGLGRGALVSAKGT